MCERAKEEYKCEMDGEIAQDEYLKIACLRTECGLSVSVQQVLQANPDEEEYEKFTQEHGASALEKEKTVDVKTQEIRKLF